MLTSKQAALICEAHEIDQLMENEEELECLEANNPELLDAYRALQKLSTGCKAKSSKRQAAMTTAARLQELIASWSHDAAVARAGLRQDDYAARCQQTVEALRELERMRAAIEEHNGACEEICKARERTDRCDRYKNRGRNCPDCPCDDRIILLGF